MGWIEDVLQGASNASAGTVSGPVDMLAWGLRKAGVHVGDAPVGGSEWMQRVGLTARPQNQWAGLAGESLGLLSPIFIQAYAPQIARGLLSAPGLLDSAFTPSYEALGPWAQKGAIVYHGSPHKFDAFDSSKIGTGEGAQAYGHGLYFADKESTAKYYKPEETNKPVSWVTEQLKSIGAPTDHRTVSAFGAAATSLKNGASDARVLQDARGLSPALANIDPDRLLAAMKGYREAGSLYKVDLPDDMISRMLDWDKPLSQQAPGVQAALRKAGIEPTAHGGTGSALISELKGRPGIIDMPWLGKGESYLREAGIPGIKYLDQGSRVAGQGTYNYVVFPGEESVLKILERNGVKLGDAPNPYVAPR